MAQPDCFPLRDNGLGGEGVLSGFDGESTRGIPAKFHLFTFQFYEHSLQQGRHEQEFSAQRHLRDDFRGSQAQLAPSLH